MDDPLDRVGLTGFGQDESRIGIMNRQESNDTLSLGATPKTLQLSNGNNSGHTFFGTNKDKQQPSISIDTSNLSISPAGSGDIFENKRKYSPNNLRIQRPIKLDKNNIENINNNNKQQRGQSANLSPMLNNKHIKSNSNHSNDMYYSHSPTNESPGHWMQLSKSVPISPVSDRLGKLKNRDEFMLNTQSNHHSPINLNENMTFYNNNNNNDNNSNSNKDYNISMPKNIRKLGGGGNDNNMNSNSNVNANVNVNVNVNVSPVGSFKNQRAGSVGLQNLKNVKEKWKNYDFKKNYLFANKSDIANNNSNTQIMSQQQQLQSQQSQSQLQSQQEKYKSISKRSDSAGIADDITAKKKPLRWMDFATTIDENATMTNSSSPGVSGSPGISDGGGILHTPKSDGNLKTKDEITTTTGVGGGASGVGVSSSMQSKKKKEKPYVMNTYEMIHGMRGVQIHLRAIKEKVERELNFDKKHTNKSFNACKFHVFHRVCH